MPAFTSADWGGLHENVVASAKHLVQCGHDIVAVSRPGLFSAALRQVGAEVIETSWEQEDPIWGHSNLFDQYSFDLVYAQPQASRRLGIQVAERQNIPIYVMFHGFYPDTVSDWRDSIDGFACVSPLLAELLTGYAQIEPWKVRVIPNGIEPELLAFEPLKLKDRTADGAGSIVVASRLESDKLEQRAVLRELGTMLPSAGETAWTVDICGDGDARPLFEELGEEMLRDSNGQVRFDFHGWVPAEEILDRLGNTVLSVGSGRLALQSVALGTPCIGVGKHGISGLSSGDRLNIGLWSSFGDYPMGEAGTTSQAAVAETIAVLKAKSDFDNVANASRMRVSDRSQDHVDVALCAFLGVDGSVDRCE